MKEFNPGTHASNLRCVRQKAGWVICSVGCGQLVPKTAAHPTMGEAWAEYYGDRREAA